MPRMTKEQIEIVRKRYEAGIGLREIGREIGFSHVAVRKLVMREAMGRYLSEEAMNHVTDNQKQMQIDLDKNEVRIKKLQKKLVDLAAQVTTKLPIGNLPTVVAVTAYLVDSGMKKNSIRNVQRILDAIEELVGGIATKQ